MKKIKLNLQQLVNAEVLTRSQLKNVLGGSAVQTTVGGDGTCNCNSADDCKAWNEDCMNSCGGKIGDTYQGKCGCP
ncbi:MAG TPA: hypothetical protein VIJ95_15515 [Hanamia sp.]